jgi:hypothetical protein
MISFARVRSVKSFVLNRNSWMRSFFDYFILDRIIFDNYNFDYFDFGYYNLNFDFKK